MNVCFHVDSPSSEDNQASPRSFFHFEKEQETEIAGGGGVKICNTFDNRLVLIEGKDWKKEKYESFQGARFFHHEPVHFIFIG